VSAQPLRDPLRAAVVELAAGLALADTLCSLAADHADPGYKADAYERAQLRDAIETFNTWRARHPQLAALATRVGARRPRPRRLPDDTFIPALDPAPAPAPHDPDHDARADRGRW
jgi:hypothetical protein